MPGIIKLLCNLNPSKALGPDSIKPIVLKNLSNEIALFLSVLFQKSLHSGQVPHDWTKACVTPIFKKGDKSNPINYRPISLTCILCKVMEHIVASNLSRHFEQNDILYDLHIVSLEGGLVKPSSFSLLKSLPVKYLSRSTNRPNLTWFQ